MAVKRATENSGFGQGLLLGVIVSALGLAGLALAVPPVPQAPAAMDPAPAGPAAPGPLIAGEGAAATTPSLVPLVPRQPAPPTPAPPAGG